MVQPHKNYGKLLFRFNLDISDPKLDTIQYFLVHINLGSVKYFDFIISRVMGNLFNILTCDPRTLLVQ